jgi:CubicO group peptidase (beta-lactamase class C family)
LTRLPKDLARELDATVAGYADTTPTVSLAYAREDEVITAGWGAEPDTLFQAASISKSVAALLALTLVAEGKLSLDGDIAAAMHTWSLPPLETDAGEWRARITLRHLLCHGAGLSVWGFPGYRRDEQLPTTSDILDGRPPANTDPVRSVAVPGLSAAYSGGGYVLLQQLLEDVAGKPFRDLAAERIFDPLRMESATLEQPIPPELEPRIARAHSAGREVEGGWHVYPELAAAGLWCTPTDLVRFARGIQSAYEDEGSAVIPQWLAAEMLEAQLPHWGLGVSLYGTPADRYFGHTGGNEGYRCELVASARRGPTAAVMTNSEEGGGLVPPLLNQLARGLGWTALARHGLAGVTSIEFGGTYETAPGSTIALEATATGATLTVADQDPLPLEIVDEHTLATADGRISLTLHGDLSGRAAGLTLRQREQEIFATRRG